MRGAELLTWWFVRQAARGRVLSLIRSPLAKARHILPNRTAWMQWSKPTRSGSVGADQG
ncbi:hypothetical protein FHX73_12159 [Kitasatospora viridis]|uniref:Uncharacterized protein n=1 Tax=Kitasatospora viridis TaxID=281105 RepID=A0A561TVB1_9ACTN|nr:hypothetical protein FHX73_12159 [Kitasatospora viridis]